MTRRDVDLVIKARDEAKGTISAITQALQDFVEGQQDVQKSASRTDTALGALGSQLGELRRALGGMSAAQRVARSLADAERQAARLAQSTQDAIGAAVAATRQAREQARETRRLSDESKRLQASIQQQTRTVRESETAERKLTSAVQNGAAARARLERAEARLGGQIARQEGVLLRARQRYADLNAEVVRSRGANEALNQRFERARQTAERARSSLEGYQNGLAETQVRLRATDQAVRDAANTFGVKAAAIEQERAALQRLIQQQRQVQAALKASSDAQKGFGAETRRAHQVLERSIADLDRAEQALRDLRRASGEAEDALRHLEQTARGPMLRAFGQQSRAVQELQEEFRDLSVEAQRLGREVNRLGDRAGTGLVARFNAAREAAARAREAFRAQQQILGEMRRVLRETGGDVEQVAQRQQRLSELQRRAAQSQKDYRRALEDAARAAERAGHAAGRAGQGARDLANGARRAAGEVRTLSDALRRFTGEGRQAFSFIHRLRSEVLSLAAAYGGLFAVLQGLRSTVGTFQNLEAATSRLNAVAGNDGARVAQELDFIRRNANRLGIEFGKLSETYTKFAVATKGTNLEGEETRRIFISVAEAARVQKISQDQLVGVFKALEQIVNKGAVQMEELRQQLGDRLPGAIQIMADGLGVTTAELVKMMEDGEVTSDALSGFADELDRRFGASLPAALKTTTTAIGAFSNALFQTFLRFGKGGFLDSFTTLVRDATEVLRSAQFESFLDRLSVAFAALTEVVAAFVQNWTLLILAATAFIGLKLAPLIVGLVARMGLLTGATVRTSRGFRALSASIRAGQVSLVSFAAAARAARIALRALLSSTGIGLAAVAIGALIGSWVTETDDATDALNRHQKILDRVRDAYDATAGNAAEWRAAVEGITLVEARANLVKLQTALRDTEKAYRAAFVAATGAGPRSRTVFGTAIFEFFEEIRTVDEAFAAGGSAAAAIEDFENVLQDAREQLEATGASAKDLGGFDALAGAVFEARKRFVEMNVTIREAGDVVTALQDNSADAAKALDRLNEKTEDAATAADRAARGAAAFETALDNMTGVLPDTTTEVDKMRVALAAAFEEAKKTAQSIDDIIAATERFNALKTKLDLAGALDLFKGANADGVRASVRLLQEREDFIDTAAPDFTIRGGRRVNSGFRVGFGSDTVTLDDGSVRKVVEGTTTTLALATRDLVRRVNEFQDVIVGQIGRTRFDAFSPEQQAALTSIAYNYGALPQRIVEEVRGGTAVQIADAIRGLRGDNDGINAGRRDHEALIFQAGGRITADAEIDAQEKARKDAERIAERSRQDAEREAERRAKDAQRAQEATRQAISDGEFEIRQQELKNEGLDRQAFIEAEIRQAKAENKAITQDQIALIAQQAERLFDLQNPNFDLARQREEAEKAEKRVNDLLTLRRELRAELKAQLESGGTTENIVGIEEGIRKVNSELQTAIDRAIALFEMFANGDPAILATVAKLRALRLTSEETANSVAINWKSVEQQFATGLTNAVEGFITGLSEGKSVTESLRESFLRFAADFLRQIARMILQQIALNTVKAIGKAISSFGVAHQGGVIGNRGAARHLSPEAFTSAMRYHSGGVAGLRPNEVPTVLERGEEVLTQDDPRHIFNLRSGGNSENSNGATGGTRIVNAFDGTDFLEQALKTKAGEELILNFVRARASAFRAAAGIR